MTDIDKLLDDLRAEATAHRNAADGLRRCAEERAACAAVIEARMQGIEEGYAFGMAEAHGSVIKEAK